MHLRYTLQKKLASPSLFVVIGKLMCSVPCPVSSFAGRAGAKLLAGGVQTSAAFFG
jgi:hypothetical protein